MLLNSSPVNRNNYLFWLVFILVATVRVCQEQLQSQDMIQAGYNSDQVTSSTDVYGVRWSLGDYFSYSNLFKTHKDYPNRRQYPANTNYYVVAFNSYQKLSGDVFAKIQETEHTCSHRQIIIENTHDHDPIEQKANSTLNQTSFHMYRCYINYDFTRRLPSTFKQSDYQKGQKVCYEYPYAIYTVNPEFLLTKEITDNKTLNRKIITRRRILFQSSFRPPVCRSFKNGKETIQKSKVSLNKNILVLGDWGIIDEEVQRTRNYIPILEPIIKRIDEDESLVLAIFLGDLGYDLIGQKYMEMMKYIQPVTSRIAFMTTPGNHDYIYHKDTFQIFAQTFMTPERDKYYNFYYNFILDDLLFINFSPGNVLNDDIIANVNPLEYIQQDLYNHYIRKLSATEPSQFQLNSNAGTPDPINRQYHVIVFSHYPIFCSKTNDGIQSCSKNRHRYKQYLNVFLDLGMDLYLSGHLHYYERLYGICWDKLNSNFTNDLPSDHVIQKQSQKDYNVEVYSDKCPVFLIEGVAGNSYFEQEEGTNKLSNFTSKLITGTGFGVLSILGGKKISKELHYTHYKMKTVSEIEIADKVIKRLPQLQNTDKQSKSNLVFLDSDFVSVRLEEMSIVLIFIMVGSLICCFYGRKFVRDFGIKKDRKDDHHVDMVEQNFEEIPGSKATHKQDTESGPKQSRQI